MTALFCRVKPQQKFRITEATIARFLKIPKHRIVRVECWKHVIFVHRRDIGGQFISYRKLRHWFNAVACQIQKCSTLEELGHLWNAIEFDFKKFKKQYEDSFLTFLQEIWLKRHEEVQQLNAQRQEN